MPATAGPWRAERGNLLHFSTSAVAKHQKLEERPCGEKYFSRNKVSQWRKNTKRGTLWDFSTSIMSQNIKKLNGGAFGENLCLKKSLTMPKKTEKGDLLVSPDIVCYAEKEELPFGSVC